MRILLIEDDLQTAEYARGGFSENGHSCDILGNGDDGLKQAVEGDYDVLVIDRMLPGLDGLSLIREVRAQGVTTPAIFLTSIGGVDDRVEGLEAGGDDYLVKPYAFSELLARVNALGRRFTRPQETLLTLHDLELNLLTREVTRGGEKILLQPKEFTLLEVLLRNAGRVVTRTMLLEQVWDFHFDPKTSVVETHISRLRAKIDKPFEMNLLHTVRNIGYSLNGPS